MVATSLLAALNSQDQITSIEKVITPSLYKPHALRTLLLLTSIVAGLALPMMHEFGEILIYMVK